jgi:hypothetical protein
MKNADLGQGWFATANDNGSFTIRNCDKGLRINLSRQEADRFVELWAAADAQVTQEGGRRISAASRGSTQ